MGYELQAGDGTPLYVVQCPVTHLFNDPELLISSPHSFSLEYSTTKPSNPTAGFSYVSDYSPTIRTLGMEDKRLLMEILCGATVLFRRRRWTTTSVS